MSNTQNDKVKKGLFALGSGAGPTPAQQGGGKVSAETRPVEPTADGEKHDHLADHEARAEDRQEALLDEAIEETFPGSDPISPKHIT